MLSRKSWWKSRKRWGLMDEAIPPNFGVKNMRWFGEKVVPVEPVVQVDLLRSGATISDLEFVLAIVKLRVFRHSGGYTWVNVNELAVELNIHENRIRSKARRAYRRNLISGCVCGCRGSFELKPAGQAMVHEWVMKRFMELGDRDAVV